MELALTCINYFELPYKKICDDGLQLQRNAVTVMQGSGMRMMDRRHIIGFYFLQRFFVLFFAVFFPTLDFLLLYLVGSRHGMRFYTR